MGWPVGKCLVRAGAPAVAMLVGKISIDVAKNGVGFVDAFEVNLWLFFLIWLAVSGFLWAFTRIMPETPL